MDKDKVKSVVECLLFVTNRPLGLDEMADITGEDPAELETLLGEMSHELETRQSALQIAKVAEGYQYASLPGFSYWVKKLFREQTTFRLSQSALETLSIIAYKQPITRAEIEEIRGVEVIGVLETLVERKLVKVAGRKESVGRPLLYATSPEFLRHFNLWKVSDLPSLEDLAKDAELSKGQEVAPPVNVEVMQPPAEVSELMAATETPSDSDGSAVTESAEAPEAGPLEVAAVAVESPASSESSESSDASEFSGSPESKEDTPSA